MTHQELRQERQRKGWSLREAAPFLGCSYVHLWKVETGRVPLRGGLLERAEQVYGGPLYWEPELEQGF